MNSANCMVPEQPYVDGDTNEPPLPMENADAAVSKAEAPEPGMAGPSGEPGPVEDEGEADGAALLVQVATVSLRPAPALLAFLYQPFHHLPDSGGPVAGCGGPEGCATLSLRGERVSADPCAPLAGNKRRN